MRLVLIGNPNSPRTVDFHASMASKFPSLVLKVVPWAELIQGKSDLRDIVRERDIVRIDSPGKDFEVERLLLRAGIDETDALPEAARASSQTINALRPDRGRILWPAQWYRGFCAILDHVSQQLRESPPHRLMNDADEIQIMFDKNRCHSRLREAGVPVAPALGPVHSFDELVARMEKSGCSRVFVKLSYGSSASGALAIRTHGRMFQAFTTVELDGLDSDGRAIAYNTRRVRELRSAADIARIVNEVCRHGVHVERWLPKAGVEGRVFDLRVVVIAGRACHTVVRLSRTPMTNLHLLNQRGPADLVRQRCGESTWAAVMNTCERAAGVFANSFYGGIDVLLTPDFRTHAVLEVNAFGDQLRGVTWRGMDTYETQMRLIMDTPQTVEAA